MMLNTLMRRFTIRTRMYSAIGVVFVLLTLVGLVGWFGIHSIEREASSYQHHNFKEMRTVSLLLQACGSLHSEIQALALHAGKAEQIDVHAQKWRDSATALHNLAAVMLEGEEDEDNPVVRDMLGMLERQQAVLEATLPTLRAPGTSTDEALTRLAPALSISTEYPQRLAAIDKVMVAESSESITEQQATADNMLWTFAGVVFLALLVVGPLTVINQVSICTPLAEARELALAIADGHLCHVVHDDGNDETADLLKALTKMQGSLTTIVSQVRISADSIAVASSEIASGNMDLSTRTESTASSLQETVSSMDQLSHTFVESADAATQANEMAHLAAQAAQRGHGIVTGVVSNMGDIQQTSQRIQDIIGVIDGIAFQTNILALNAAVEAARAGEQGRGFAVVASEVRSLAQRSAGAAREIKGLIQASSDTVTSGTRLVQDAGAAMSEILQSISRVSGIMAEITVASSDQRQGMVQINQAVTHLDQMTQQNAALVEQSAAASSSLQDQANSLKQAMSAFHL
jgi:methyl-accepting chemotaxis protein